MQKFAQYALNLVFCAILVFNAHALDLDGSREGSCDGVDYTPSRILNETWMRSIPTWYPVAGSKFYYYRSLLHHYNGNYDTLANIPADSLHSDACFVFTTVTLQNTSGLPTLTAFDPRRRSEYSATHRTFGIFEFAPVPPNRRVGLSRHFITMTDNKSFIFNTNCHLDGGRNYKSWSVFATTPKPLSKGIMTQIKAHARAHGFDEDKFAYLGYNNCKPGLLHPNAVFPTIPTTNNQVFRNSNEWNPLAPTSHESNERILPNKVIPAKLRQRFGQILPTRNFPENLFR